MSEKEAVSVRASCFFFRSIVSLSSGSGDQAMAMLEVRREGSSGIGVRAFGVFLFSTVRGFGCSEWLGAFFFF